MAEMDFKFDEPEFGQKGSKTIHDIPDEVLDYILALVSTYADLRSCHLVSRRWREAVHRVSRNHGVAIEKAMPQMKLLW